MSGVLTDISYHTGWSQQHNKCDFDGLVHIDCYVACSKLEMTMKVFWKLPEASIFSTSKLCAKISQVFDFLCHVTEIPDLLFSHAETGLIPRQNPFVLGMVLRQGR